MTKGPARIATITVIVACILFHLSFLIVQVNLCQPVSRVSHWWLKATNLFTGSEAMGPHYHLGELSTSSSGLHHHGVSYYLLWYCGVSIQCVRTLLKLSDKHSMLLPFPVLLQSHIQKRKKFVLLGLLALGIFITIIQVIRIRTVKNLSNYLDSASLILWSTVENNMGIMSK